MKNKKSLSMYSIALLTLLLTACSGGSSDGNPDHTPATGTTIPDRSMPAPNNALNPATTSHTNPASTPGDSSPSGNSRPSENSNTANPPDNTSATNTGSPDASVAPDTPAPAMPTVAAVFTGHKLEADGTRSQSLNSFDGKDGHIFTITVTGANANIALKITKDNIHPLTPGEQNIKPLQDIDGTLLGYYGHISAISTEPSRDGTTGTEKIPQLAIFYAMTGATRLPTETTATYTGKLLYSVSGVKREADANFHYASKTLNGTIKDTDNGANQWTVAGDKTVTETGTFNTRLMPTGGSTISPGTMQGGFFGQQGQLLAAEAKSTTETAGSPEWAGIVIAEKHPAHP